jgi:hypothetical protein
MRLIGVGLIFGLSLFIAVGCAEEGIVVDALFVCKSRRLREGAVAHLFDHPGLYSLEGCEGGVGSRHAKSHDRQHLG